MKRISKLFFLVLIILMFLGGCDSFTIRRRKAKERAEFIIHDCEEAERYLYERYGEEFVCSYHGSDSIPGSMTASGERFVMRLKGYEDYKYYPQGVFRIIGTIFNDSNDYTYRDGYLNIYGREKVRLYVEELIKPLFNEQIYFVGITPVNYEWVYSNYITKDTPVDKMYDVVPEGETGLAYWKYEIWIPFSVYNSAEKIDELSLKIAKLLKEHKQLGYVEIFPYYDEKLDLFLKHQNYFLNKILEGEELDNYYSENSIYSTDYLVDCFVEILNRELSSRQFNIQHYRVQVEDFFDKKGPIKIYGNDMEEIE